MAESVDLESIKKCAEELNRTSYYSILDCFNIHNGYRKGEIHTIVGPRGGGKSSLTKTIILDFLTQNKKVFLWLSEELPETYLISIYNLLRKKFNNDQDKIREMLANLKIITELRLEESYNASFMKSLEYDLEDFGADALIYDNYTTGKFSAMQYDKQTKLLSIFMETLKTKNIPIILVFHSDKNTNPNDRPMTSENVKGFSRPVDIGSYNYVLQPVTVENIRVNFLIVEKARYHSGANRTYWELKFNSNLEIYEKSSKISYAEYMLAFKKGKK